MAKVSLPLLSRDATGALAKTITFQKSGSRLTAKRWSAPTGQVSVAQTARRNLYQAAVDAWNLLSPEQRLVWEAIAAPLNITGYNAFLSDALSPAPPVQGTIWDDGATTWDSGSTLWDI